MNVSELYHCESLYRKRHPKYVELKIPPNANEAQRREIYALRFQELQQLVQAELDSSPKIEALYLRHEGLTNLDNADEWYARHTLRNEMYARGLLDPQVTSRDPSFACISNEELLKLWNDEEVEP